MKNRKNLVKLAEEALQCLEIEMGRNLLLLSIH